MKFLKLANLFRIGDFLDAFLALHFISICCKIDGGLPIGVKLRMLLNVIFDFILGLLPIVGDITDMLFQANVRNAGLLERVLEERLFTQLM